MIIAFAGTRHGLTPDQQQVLRSFLEDLKPTRAHQGCPIGADFKFAEMVYQMGVPVVGHPSNLEKMTSEPALACCAEVRPARPPLDRNRDSGAACELLIACPGSEVEKLRSGTWATGRYGKRVGKRIMIITPSGEMVA